MGELELVSDTNSNNAMIFKHLGIAIQRIDIAIKCIDTILDDVNDNTFQDNVSDE